MGEISNTAQNFAKSFGGADGFGGDSHDRDKLKNAGLTYDSNGAVSIQDVLGSAGNNNQFHISASGVEQTKRVFQIAENEGMLKDGNLTAEELSNLKGIIEGSVEPSSPASKALVGEIQANKGSLTGSPQGAHASAAEIGDMAQIAAAFTLMDFLSENEAIREMLGLEDAEELTPEKLKEFWGNATDEEKQKIKDLISEKLQETGKLEEHIAAETVEEFGNAMDQGDVEGAVSIIESDMEMAAAELESDHGIAQDMADLKGEDDQDE